MQSFPLHLQEQLPGGEGNGDKTPSQKLGGLGDWSSVRKWVAVEESQPASLWASEALPSTLSYSPSKFIAISCAILACSMLPKLVRTQK